MFRTGTPRSSSRTRNQSLWRQGGSSVGASSLGFQVMAWARRVWPERASRSVDRLALDVVSEEALVVGVSPLALFRADPVVVNALDDLLAVDLEVLEPAGKGPVDAWLGERVLDRPEHGAVPARGIARFVVFGLDGHALVPAGQDGPLPGFGQVLSGDGQGRDVSAHVGTSRLFPAFSTGADGPSTDAEMGTFLFLLNSEEVTLKMEASPIPIVWRPGFVLS